MSVHLNDAAISEFFKDPDGPIGRIIEHKAYAVEMAAQALLLIPGTGRYYPPGILTFRRDGKIYSNYSTGGRQTGHIASAPGEPPASDTGMLLASINHKIMVENTVFARVGSDRKYAIYLELGTRFMAPRPFLRPALDIGMAS
jgi:hypothetical protein